MTGRPAQGPRWGATWDDGRLTARLWAPRAARVELLLDSQALSMTALPEGYWTVTAPAPAGIAYRLRVDGADMPDPASRRQAGGVHDPSLAEPVPDHDWQHPWAGRDWAEAVIYELHVGTFTPEGTLAAAASRLQHLADLGFTAIELMPLNQFPGDRGWGYDGVLPFALHPTYGAPADLCRFVDMAHGAGLMVILDLVMNHFGPDGAYIHQAAPDFFDTDRHTPWGAAIDFSKAPVRAFWTECAEYWLRTFRLDGFRLDAVHQITGPGATDFLDAFAGHLRQAAPDRPIHLITEDERNLPDLRERHGYDASWNDDFHHAVHTALTGESDGYYASFAHDPIGDLALALARGHIEEGQPRPGLDHPRGQPCGHLPATAFVNAIQTHDQVGNRPHGERLASLADPQGVAVAYALLLVAPYIPMVFMGEERGETAPFLFFADFQGDLARAVREGRAAEFAAIAELGETVPDPLAFETFERSRLGWRDDARAREWLELTRRALAFRAEKVVPLVKSGRRGEARVRRLGPASVAADWPFHAGTLSVALSLGQAQPDLPLPRAPGLVLGRPGRDPFALSAGVEVP